MFRFIHANRLRCAAAICTAAALHLPGAVMAQSAQGQFEQVVLQIIRENPQVILEALQNLDPRAAAAGRMAADPNNLVRQAAPSRPELAGPDVIQASLGDLHDLEHGLVIGNPDGQHTVVEFVDFRCGFCRRVHATVKQLIAENPDTRVILRQFPVLGPDSENAARVFLAAVQQDRSKAVDLNDLFIAHEGPFDIATLATLAGTVGYDVASLQTAATGFGPAIQAERALATSLGIRGTPAFVFGSTMIVPGARDYETFMAVLNQVRNAPPAVAQQPTANAATQEAIREFLAVGTRRN